MKNCNFDLITVDANEIKQQTTTAENAVVVVAETTNPFLVTLYVILFFNKNGKKNLQKITK